MDAKTLKSNLTLDDYKKILDVLGIPITSQHYNMWDLKGGCHAQNVYESDSNLKFYTDTQTFTCYSHNCIRGGDIIQLVLLRQRLFNENYQFVDAMNFIINALNLTERTISKHRQNWKDIFKFQEKEVKPPSKVIYNDNILTKFENLYYQGWIDEDISINTMNKFNILWYERMHSIVIPCYDECGDLIGIRSRFLNVEDIEYGKYRPLKLLSRQYKFPTGLYFYGEYENKQNILDCGELILVEAEKSVLQAEDILDVNNTLALYGHSLSKFQLTKLIEWSKQGLKSVIIGLDFDYNSKDDKLYQQFRNTLWSIVKQLKPYFEVSVLISEGGHKYKDSPFDNGKEFLNNLINAQIRC